MQVSAEIHLGTRSVLEYLLSPVQKIAHEAGGTVDSAVVQAIRRGILKSEISKWAKVVKAANVKLE